MTLRYAVGIKIGNKADQMTVEAEDALIAALKVKTAHPEAMITYVRKRNAPGDRHHPHSSQSRRDCPWYDRRDYARPHAQASGPPPAEPIIIKDPPRPPEVPEVDGSPDEEEEEDPEIKRPPIIPGMPPSPGPWEQADWHR
jgi:hypothetical protein